MKIGFEAQRIFRAHKHGMDVVALELIRRLTQSPTGHRFLLFAAKGPDTQFITASPHLQIERLRGLSYADREQIALPRAVKKYQADILHCTANTAPLRPRVPLILTLHDVMYLSKNVLGGSFYQDLGNLYRRWIVPTAIKNASAIVTVSDYERKNIIHLFPETAAKISVVYNGVDERFHPKYADAEKAAMRQRYGLPDEFILFLGNTAPKKNSPRVIEAYVHYCEQVAEPLPLVVTDYSRKLVSKALARIKKTSDNVSIILPGYVEIADMPLLYNCSTVFLYPSLQESFGLPILEAMACGVPVITSQSAAMPEVAGAAAELVDPSNHEAIAQSMHRVLQNAELRQTYIQKGLARAAHFNWDNAVSQLLQVYSNHQH